MELNQEYLKLLPKELQIEISENIFRKDFSESEKANIQKELIKSFSELKQQGKRNDLTSAECSAKVGRITDLVGKVFNESGDNVEKRQQIVDSGNEKLIKKMDETGNVNRAYTELKQEKRNEGLQQRSAELPKEIFQVIYADPAWQYENSGLNGGAESHYPTMSIDEMCAMGVKNITDGNCVLFMWTTNPLLQDAFKVMSAWGFEYKTNLVWVKEKSNYGKLGFYVYGQHELLLIGTKGSMLPIGEKPKSIIQGENNIHSKKPECVYDIIETMYPNLKYVELFARNARDGWRSWGNQV